MDYSRLIESDDDLLAALDCKKVEHLKMIVDDHLDLDLTDFHLDDGVAGCVDCTACFVITYPVTLDGFWHQVDDAEWLANAYLEAGALAEQVLEVEGFTVAFSIADLQDVREEGKGYPAMPEYPYRRRAPTSWSAEHWLERRLQPLLDGLPFSASAMFVDHQSLMELGGGIGLGELRGMQQRSELFGGAYR